MLCDLTPLLGITGIGVVKLEVTLKLIELKCWNFETNRQQIFGYKKMLQNQFLIHNMDIVNTF